MKYEVVFYETNRYTTIVEADSEEEARAECDFLRSENLTEDMDFYDLSIIEVNELDDEEE